MPVFKATATICNMKGLHARASSKFVNTAQEFESEISVTRGGESVNGRSILDLMMLAAARGDTIEIMADGDDAEKAVAALTELVSERFGESC